MENKQTFQEKVEARIEQLDAEIDLLKAKARKVKAEAKLEAVDQLEKVDQERAGLQEQLKEFNASGKDAWQDLKGGINEALEDLEESLDQARSNF